MAGTNLGMAKASFFGCRVATQIGCPTDRKQVEYTPAHTRSDGKEIRTLCKITAFVNNKYGKANIFVFSVFGTLADTCAKAMSPGKEFNCTCSINSFRKGIYNEHGERILKSDGTPLTTKDSGYTIEDMTFGSDSQKFIDWEIAEGKRVPEWNTTEKGMAWWKSILKSRNEYKFTPGMTEFGFARVLQPRTTNAAVPNAAFEQVFGNAKLPPDTFDGIPF